jgi:hypothetical protein
MTENWREIVWRQVGAVLDMLEFAIRVCPDELWSRPAAQMGFWYLAYHTLFYIDYDLSPSAERFHSASFDIHEYEIRELPPPYEHPYSRADVEAYLRLCRAKCKRALAALDAEDRTLRGSRRKNCGFLEIVLYSLRHVQHHAAQLNLLLRQEIDSAPLWVSKAKEPLE